MKIDAISIFIARKRSLRRLCFYKCLSVHSGGGGSTSVHAGIPPHEQTPPPGSRACWEIRSTSGRYASYWNAILFFRRSFWPVFFPIENCLCEINCYVVFHYRCANIVYCALRCLQVQVQSNNGAWNRTEYDGEMLDWIIGDIMENDCLLCALSATYKALEVIRRIWESIEPDR